MDFLKDLELTDEVKAKIAEAVTAHTQAQIETSIGGLKAKNDELLAEKKRVQRERDEAANLAKTEAEEKAKASNDYKQLFEAQKNEAEQLKSKMEELQTNIKRGQIKTTAAKIAAGLTKDTARASLLEQQITARLTLTDDGIKVLDDSGQLTVSTLDDLTATIKTAYPFLVDGSQANGGGASRSQGGADGGRKKVSRSDFDVMAQSERAKFVKDGGKVISD
jgi:FtsZ-binding cell division protein ZapB